MNISKVSTSQITTALFWVGFVSFISVSIPHVAWLYQVNQPDVWYTTVTSYGVAVGIDVLVAWLSYMCARGKLVDAGVTVAFIVLLSSLSCYANYLCDQAHNPLVGDKVWSINIVFGATTTGYVTPLVTSAIPFFSLAYTFMLSRLSKTEVDLGELEKQWLHEQELNKLRARFGKDQEISLENKAKRLIDSVVNVARHAQNQVTGQPIETQTDTLHEVSEAPKQDLHEVSSGPASPRNMTLEDAASLLQCEVKIVKRLVTQGTLYAPNGSKKLVTRASVDALLDRRTTRNTEKIGAVNGGLKETINLDEYPEILV